MLYVHYSYVRVTYVHVSYVITSNALKSLKASTIPRYTGQGTEEGRKGGRDGGRLTYGCMSWPVHSDHALGVHHP